ncbi:MAG: zinc ribbon domain-containing protein [Gemmatimonadetes bacterium]|nr:zinc ribbon domain-containing protein [Gemmatimonadota bacterium]
MTLLACGLLALGVLAYMISPMLERSDRRPWSARSAWAAWARRDDLQKKKDFIYSSIRELNIDYSMGKLAAEDHETLRQEYMKEASDVLDELDRTAGSELPVEEQIEEAVLEIRRRREPGAAVVEAPVEVTKNSEEQPAQLVRPVQPVSGQSCGGCGTVNEESAKFCIECGASLTRIACEGCGTENPATAKFCAQCGIKLNAN